MPIIPLVSGTLNLSETILLDELSELSNSR